MTKIHAKMAMLVRSFFFVRSLVVKVENHERIIITPTIPVGPNTAIESLFKKVIFL